MALASMELWKPKHALHKLCIEKPVSTSRHKVTFSAAAYRSRGGESDAES